MVGLGRIELPTSRLSGVRSSHLSYRPSRLTRTGAGRRLNFDSHDKLDQIRRVWRKSTFDGSNADRCTEEVTLESGFLSE